MSSDAEHLMAQAEKKLNAGFLSSLFSSSNRYEDAEELYTKAANQFKLAKKWKEAGDAFSKAADMQIRLGERDEAATRFVDASNAYKKVSPQDAVDSLKQAIDILTERGRFQMAAKHQKTVAEIYETDLVDLEKAMTAYETAAEWFQGEDASALANNCLTKVAHLAAQLEQYQRAIELFERIAASSLENSLTKWGVRDILLKAGLCHLASGDLVGAQRAAERYCDMDVTFAATRECGLYKSLLEALEQGDPDVFTGYVAEYDKMTKLDDWKTTLLLRIKKSMDQSFT
ncbi:hypothetical protein GGF32_002380 [Allomyces javanicus]|nr:hypothetical protein GGF32_002380 [Allomyces javanicus]